MLHLSIILGHRIQLQNVSIARILLHACSTSTLGVDRIKIHLMGLLPLVIANLLAINLGQLRQNLDNELPIKTVLRARVVAEPQHPQMLQILQVI